MYFSFRVFGTFTSLLQGRALKFRNNFTCLLLLKIFYSCLLYLNNADQSSILTLKSVHIRVEDSVCLQAIICVYLTKNKNFSY